MNKNDNNKRKLNEDWAYLNEAITDIALQSSDVEFNKQYEKSGLRKSIQEKNLNESKKDDLYDQSEIEEERIYNEISNQSQKLIHKKLNDKNQKLKKKLSLQTKIRTQTNPLALARTQVINGQIIFWNTYIWLFVQVPFAVFLILLFAVIGGATSVASDSNFIVSTLSGLLGWIGSVIGLTSAVEAFFFITWLIIIVIGFILIFTVFIQHTLARNKPLGGRAFGLKLGALLLTFIGYSVPVLNILPWILIWIFVIGKYPK